MSDGVKVAIYYLIGINIAFLLACDFSEKPYCFPWDNCSHKRYLAAQESFNRTEQRVRRLQRDADEFKQRSSEFIDDYVSKYGFK